MCRPRILSVHPIYWWRPFSRSRKSKLDILFTNQGAHYLSNGLLTNPLKDKWEIVSTSRQVIDRLRREEHEDLNQNQKFLSPPPPHYAHCNQGRLQSALGAAEAPSGTAGADSSATGRCFEGHRPIDASTGESMQGGSYGWPVPGRWSDELP